MLLELEQANIFRRKYIEYNKYFFLEKNYIELYLIYEQ